MIRVEVTTDAGGHIAMLLPDDSAGSYASAIRLAAAVHVPASVRMIPIPPDVTGRQALYWYPKRTPHKEKKVDQSTPPCLDDCDDGTDPAT